MHVSQTKIDNIEKQNRLLRPRKQNIISLSQAYRRMAQQQKYSTRPSRRTCSRNSSGLFFSTAAAASFAGKCSVGSMNISWRAKTTVLMLSTGLQSLLRMGRDTCPVWRLMLGCHARDVHTTVGASQGKRQRRQQRRVQNMGLRETMRVRDEES